MLLIEIVCLAFLLFTRMEALFDNWSKPRSKFVRKRKKFVLEIRSMIWNVKSRGEVRYIFSSRDKRRYR